MIATCSCRPARPDVPGVAERTREGRGLYTPPSVRSRRVIRPQAGPQEDFLATPADIAIYGGAAGGGKTWALLIEAIRHVQNSMYGGVIFPRVYPQIMT